MPWYIALTGSILFITIGIYKKMNIGLVMALGAVALGLLSGLPLLRLITIMFNGLTNQITLMLAVSIILLGVLGLILKKTGALEEIINNLQGIVADIRIISAAIPALIGMLTVPGGAILSAPLCAEAGNQLSLPPHRQAAANIWFRHILYFMLPLFPSLILASKIAEVSMSRFIFFNLPMTVIGILSGFFFLFRGYKSQHRGFSFKALQFWLLLKSLSPLLLIMLLVVIWELYFPLAITAGIVLALFNYLPPENRWPQLLQRLHTMVIPGIKFSVAFVIVGIMIYKEMLEQSAVLTDMTQLFINLGIPVIVLITVIPFLVGMLTGDNSASVAVIFPMFLPLLPQNVTVYAAYVAFLYASSTAGHIISPAHPCFALTKEYFSVDLKKIILPILPLLILIMATGLLTTLLFTNF